MKLLTHNMLQSPGTRHGYPLAIEAEKIENVETEFNPDFIQRMVEKLDYPGLLATVTGLGMQESLPAAVPANFAEDEDFLKALHHVILEVEIIEGHLICPETGKRFPVKDGIPSML